MTGRERRTLTALDTLYKFSVMHLPKQLPDLPPQFAATTKQLKEVLHQISTLSIGRASKSPFKRARGQREHLLTRLLTEYLQPMRRIAKFSGIASDTSVAFTVPRPRTAIATILEQAREYVTAARPHRETFVELGMDADFLEALEALLEQLAGEAGTASEAFAQHVQDGREFRTLLKEGRRLAWLLDTIVRRHCARIMNTRTTDTPSARLANTQNALAGWKGSFRIERDPVRKARRLTASL